MPSTGGSSGHLPKKKVALQGGQAFAAAPRAREAGDRGVASQGGQHGIWLMATMAGGHALGSGHSAAARARSAAGAGRPRDPTIGRRPTAAAASRSKTQSEKKGPVSLFFGRGVGFRTRAERSEGDRQSRTDSSAGLSWHPTIARRLRRCGLSHQMQSESRVALRATRFRT